MRTGGKKTYIGRRKERDVNWVKPTLIVFVILLVIVGLYFGVRIAAIRNSPEFDLTKVSAYYFYLPDLSTDISKIVETRNSLIIVDGNKRVVDIIDIPATLFVSSSKIDASNTNPKDFAVAVLGLLQIKSDYVYTVTLKSDYLRKIGVSNIDEMVNTYGKRGLKIFDYFSLKGQVSILRPESIITDASLAKLYSSLGKFNIRKHTLPLLTQKPLKITVDGKIYYRTYLDEEKLSEFLEELKK
ncbi:MAG: hypothetical protein ACUVQF_02370 [Fervidobacterium sp.]|uniref:hypothetical protein n=1 Tax=Fervidobacterium sp. TaxID=1871331 RepID=UPI00404B1FB3